MSYFILDPQGYINDNRRRPTDRVRYVFQLVCALLLGLAIGLALASCGGSEVHTIVIGVTPLPVCADTVVGVSACDTPDTPSGLCIDQATGTYVSGCAIDKQPRPFACVEACP